MGFSVDVVADILKFPSPLFPKFKNQCPLGFRYEIPLTQDTANVYNFQMELPTDNEFELQGVSVSQSGYSDRDYFELLVNNTYVLKQIFTKQLGQEKDIRPIVKIKSTDVVKFVYNNATGTSKTVWVDLELTCKKPITNN